jgi:hypothetical protein
MTTESDCGTPDPTPCPGIANRNVTHFLNGVTDIFFPTYPSVLSVDASFVMSLWRKTESIFLSAIDEKTREQAISVLMYLSLYCSMKKIHINKDRIQSWQVENNDSHLAEYFEEILFDFP